MFWAVVLVVVAAAAAVTASAVDARLAHVLLQPTSFSGVIGGGVAWTIGDHSARPCSIDDGSAEWDIGIVAAYHSPTGVSLTAAVTATEYVVIGDEPLPPSVMLLDDASGVRVLAVRTRVRRLGTNGVADFDSHFEFHRPVIVKGDDHSSPVPWNTSDYETVTYATGIGTDLAGIGERLWREVIAGRHMRYFLRALFQRNTAHVMKITCMHTEVVFDVPYEAATTTPLPPSATSPAATTSTTTTSATTAATTASTVDAVTHTNAGATATTSSAQPRTGTTTSGQATATRNAAVAAVPGAPSTPPPVNTVVYALCGAIFFVCTAALLVSLALHARRHLSRRRMSPGAPADTPAVSSASSSGGGAAACHTTLGAPSSLMRPQGPNGAIDNAPSAPALLRTEAYRGGEHTAYGDGAGGNIGNYGAVVLGVEACARYDVVEDGGANVYDSAHGVLDDGHGAATEQRPAPTADYDSVASPLSAGDVHYEALPADERAAASDYDSASGVLNNVP